MNPKSIKLKRGEWIMAVVPEHCVGPGWANSPVWVYIAANDGTMRSECVQPEEQTPQMIALFGVGAAMCDALKRSVPTKRANK